MQIKQTKAMCLDLIDNGVIKKVKIPGSGVLGRLLNT